MSTIALTPGLWLPTRDGAEWAWGDLERDERRLIDRLLKTPAELWDHVLLMAGSTANYTSAKLQGLVFGKTAYAGETTLYQGLWTSALDDTFTGATAGEAAYTSYARLALTNNTTIFPAGTGSTTVVNTYPGDAIKSWPTSTGSTSTVTYLGCLNGNAGSSADKGVIWCSVTSTTINSGDTPQLAQNAVSITWD